MQYVLNVQRTVGKSTTLEVGYTGSVSRHLAYLLDENQGILSASLPAVQRLPYPELGASGIQYVMADADGNYSALGRQVDQAFRQQPERLAGLHVVQVPGRNQQHPRHGERLLAPECALPQYLRIRPLGFQHSATFRRFHPLHSAVRQRPAISSTMAES